MHMDGQLDTELSICGGHCGRRQWTQSHAMPNAATSRLRRRAATMMMMIVSVVVAAAAATIVGQPQQCLLQFVVAIMIRHLMTILFVIAKMFLAVDATHGQTWRIVEAHAH